MLKRIAEEINNYQTGSIQIAEGINFSTYRMLRRISLYKNQVYPTGNLDAQGNYKYYFDIVSPRVNSEIKNLDFDSKDVLLFSDSKADAVRVLIANVALREWMVETGEAARINEAIEQGPEWGNIVWKKQKNGYKVLDLTNVMVLNESAKDLSESDVIEKEVFLSTDLRKMSGTWNNVEKLIKAGKPTDKKTNPEFYVYERNGEVSEKEYYKTKALLDKDFDDKGKDYPEDKFVLAKIVVGGVEKGNPMTVLFCDTIVTKPYKEFHRSTYSGRWLRVGLYEQLMDCQQRANEIGNQIARGLEWSSKIVFKTGDKIIAQNILTDLRNGDVVKADLSQVDVRMHGLDQLLADWNRNLTLADQLSNSYEVVTGGNLPSGTPFRLGALQNANANKLFDFIREKLSIALRPVLTDFVLPVALKDIKALEVIKITADSGLLESYYNAVIDSWYITNLAAFPPHTKEQAKEIKSAKLEELMKIKEVLVKLEKKMWEDFKPRVKITIVGENYNLAVELETLETFIALSVDPVRREALIERALKLKGIDVGSLPKTEQPIVPIVPEEMQRQNIPTQVVPEMPII